MAPAPTAKLVSRASVSASKRYTREVPDERRRTGNVSSGPAAPVAGDQRIRVASTPPPTVVTLLVPLAVRRTRSRAVSEYGLRPSTARSALPSPACQATRSSGISPRPSTQVLATPPERSHKETR